MVRIVKNAQRVVLCIKHSTTHVTTTTEPEIYTRSETGLAEHAEQLEA